MRRNFISSITLKVSGLWELSLSETESVSYTHLDVYKRQQQYDGIEGSFSPDFTIRPCPMFTSCHLIDPDNPGETPVFNSQLDTFKGSEVTSSGIVVVATSENASVKAGYEAVREGSDKECTRLIRH